MITKDDLFEKIRELQQENWNKQDKLNEIYELSKKIINSLTTSDDERKIAYKLMEMIKK